MSDAESYFVDEEGEPYPPLVRKLIRKVLDGASVGTESKERLATVSVGRGDASLLERTVGFPLSAIVYG